MKSGLYFCFQNRQVHLAKDAPRHGVPFGLRQTARRMRSAHMCRLAFVCAHALVRLSSNERGWVGGGRASGAPSYKALSKHTSKMSCHRHAHDSFRNVALEPLLPKEAAAEEGHATPHEHVLTQAEAERRTPKIGLFTLCMLLFSQASAGPCGLEGIVGAVGVWLSMISQAATVILFSVPQAFVAVELARGVPENGGYAVWAERSLGRTWGVAAGVWGVVATCAYSASLVQNISEYMRLNVALVADRWPQFGLVCGLALIAGVIASLPLKRSGQAYALITAFTVCVFAVLLGFCGTHLNVRAEPIVPPGAAGSGGLLAMADLLVFNAIYFDGAAMYAGETRNPDKTIPAAVAIIASVVTTVNLVTTFITYFGSGGGPHDAWQGGHFAVVAQYVRGPHLRDAIIANAFVTNFQIMTSGIQNSAYLLSGMAAHGLAPKWLRAKCAGSASARAVALCCVSVAVFGLLPFERSLSVQSVVYGGVVLVECAAYVVKRSRAGTTVEAIAVAILPTAFVAFSYSVQERNVLIGCLSGMLGSLALAHALLVAYGGSSTSEPLPAEAAAAAAMRRAVAPWGAEPADGGGGASSLAAAASASAAATAAGIPPESHAAHKPTLRKKRLEDELVAWRSRRERGFLSASPRKVCVK